MDSGIETTFFGEVLLKIGILSVLVAVLMGIGSLIYYLCGFSQETSALQLINSGRWSEEIKANIHNTYLHLFISFYICLISAVIIFSDPVLFWMFSSFGMMIIDFVVEMFVQTGRTFVYLNSEGIFNTQRIVWTIYCAFLGGISSPALLLGPNAIRISIHITCILVVGLIIISLIAPAGKYAAWHKNLNVFEIFVFVGSIGAALFPITTSTGASFFSISFYGGLITFPLCFLCHSQEAQIMASEASPENPYCAAGMCIPMLLDTISIFTRIVMSSGCDCPVVHTEPTLASTCGGSTFMLFMGLLEVFIRSQCDLEDPCGRPNETIDLDREYDFIVVGGGSAGSVVASRLSEIPNWKVLLIEAGGNEPTGTQIPSMFFNFVGSNIDWQYKTEPEERACLNEPQQRCSWPRGKVLGGTSVMNGMMYMRGSRHDYDQWAALGNKGWSFEEVLPYFLKSEDNLQIDRMDQGFHGIGGYLTVTQFPYHPPLSYAILQAGKEMGYEVRDLNGRKHTGFTIAQTTTRNGSRLSSSKAFIRPVKSRPNLQILLNTTVARVLINQETKQVYGVEIIDKNGRRKPIYVRNEVIVSGGAVASPQILLLSGIGPKEDLVKLHIPVIHDLPGVGKNLQNHVSFFLNFFINDTNTTPLNWATAMEYLLFRDGLMSGTGISEVTAFLPSKYQNPLIDHPDLQYFFGGFLANCAKTGQVGELSNDGSQNRVINIIPVLLHPKSRGYVTLKSSDPLDHPKIVPRYLTHPDDAKRLVDGIKIGIRMTETSSLKKYGFKIDQTPVQGCENFTFGCDEYWYCALARATGPENHQAGSCKMGPPQDPLAVVDPQLRVYGIKGLRVADTSIMPIVTSANTNAPAIMIAEKAADFIKNMWLRRFEARFQNSNWF